MVYGSDNHMFAVIHNNLTSKSHKTCLSAYPQRPQNHPNEVAKSHRTLQLPTPNPPTSQTETRPPSPAPMTQGIRPPDGHLAGSRQAPNP